MEHIRWLSEAFRDPRYITVDGRPLLLVYRPQLLPNARSTFETWRKHCADAGLPEPYICKFETYGDFGDPARIGCDASAEFLPHGVPENMPPPVAPPGCHPDDTVFDYAEVAAAFASRQPVPWRRYSCVLPGWDNSPRQLDSSAFLLHGADPAVYRRWLTGTVDRSLAEGRDIVFVNAWNEWAEGAHLEPDQRFGRAFLEATRQALEDSGYGPAFSGPASTMGTTADAHPGADRPAPASLARSYEDLSERFVRLQRTQTEQYGALRRATDRELERLTAELEAARCDARTIARWAQRLEADLSLRRDGETGLPRGATVARDAAAAPAAAARHSGPPTATRRYLDLLKGCLTRLLFVDEEAAYTKHPGGTRSLLRLREHGRDWPATAETMIGMARLDNVEWCVTEALRDGVGGDLLEAGVWRGGASILMRAVLAAYGDTTRTVWLADSFRGLPPPDRTRFPDEMAEDLSVFPQLAVSLRTVEDNFARYGLLDDQVRVLPGTSPTRSPPLPSTGWRSCGSTATTTSRRSSRSRPSTRRCRRAAS